MALHEHRIDPQTLGGSVEFSFDAGGNLMPVDFTAYDQAVEPWVDGTKFGDGIGVNRFDVGQFGPGNGTGTMTDTEYAAAGKAFAEHLEAKGWWSKAYTYSTDEPWHQSSPSVAYAAIAHDADLLIGATDLWRGHILVTSPFQSAIAGRIGIWCPVDAMYEDWNSFFGPEPGRKTYAQRRAMGEELWFYTDNADLPPYAGYDIDTAIGYEPRIVKWGAFYERATGFLYWNTQYWVNDDPWNVLSNVPGFGELFARNGDGFIFYPGNHDGTAMGKGSPSWLAIDGPIVSYRMKQIRDGLEDWEMFQMAVDLGAESYLRAQLARAYSRFGAFFITNCNTTGDYCPDKQPWTLDETVLADARHDVASKILYLLHPGMYPDPEAPPPPPPPPPPPSHPTTPEVAAGGWGCQLDPASPIAGVFTGAVWALLALARRRRR